MSIVLQKPQMMEIQGSTLRIAHPNLERNPKTYLASDLAASGSASISVYDNEVFANGDYFILGWPGSSKTEEDVVSGAVTRGQTLVGSGSNKFYHSFNAPVIKIDERKVKIYGNSSASESGATLIATVDIQWSKKFTEYTVTGSTFAYYYAVFTDGTTDSSASDFVASGGLENNSAQKIIDSALGMCGASIGQVEGLTKEYLVASVGEGQDEITQYVDEDTGNIRNWAFEEVWDEGLSVSEMEHRYALSGMTNTVKFTQTGGAFLDLWIGYRYQVRHENPNDFFKRFAGRIVNYLAATINAGDTSLTLVNGSEFSADGGTLRIGGDTITYTARSGNSFTGIPSSGTGAITETHTAGASVWQGMSGGSPTRYTVDGGYLYFDTPFDVGQEGYSIRAKIYKQLTSISELSDTTDVPFYNILKYYVAYKIELARKNMTMATTHLSRFKELLDSNAGGEKTNAAETESYYDFENGSLDYGNDESNWPNAEAGRDNPVS